LALAILALCQRSGARADDRTGVLAAAAPFFEQHCLDCHGAELHRANLRLDALGADLVDPHVFETWVKVYDKVVSGEMPPKKRERPAERDRDALLTRLHDALHGASRERQQKLGRVPVRRLNSTEYENTVRELVGTNVELRELLPEDNLSDGFDNVSAVLDIAATHLLRYQQAAERAIRSAIPEKPNASFSDRRTGREITRKGAGFPSRLGLTCRLQGDALIFYAKNNRFVLCQTAHVPITGRYRVQMSAAAVGTGDRPLAVAVLTDERGIRQEPVLRDVRDFAPGEPQFVELEVDLKENQALALNLFNRGIIAPRNGPPIEEYKGPGLLVEWMKIEGPIGTWPPVSYEKLFAGVPLKQAGDQFVPTSAEPQRDAERLIRSFLPRAFRRPVSKPVEDFYVARVLDKLDKGYSFADAMIFGYKEILSAPRFFLLLDEPDSEAEADPGAINRPRLDDYGLASRLAYFLWSSPPDDELKALAASEKLSQPDVLRGQVERLLRSPKAQQFTKNFAGQWLDLRKISDTIPDLRLYSEFDDHLHWSMPRETELFFDEVLGSDLSVLEFVDSSWTMLNERLARHYGTEGVVGNQFRKVELPPESHRGGVMTQASVLKVTADGTRTSPVLRGKWVLERIIGKPPANPPPDVPPIEPDIRGTTTIRQQLDKHRAIASCASCHAHIDPPGFALENFDPIGNWRTYYRTAVQTRKGLVRGTRYNQGPDVEQGGQMADGRAFRDIEEFKKLLLTDADRDQIVRNVAQKLLTYATGASIQFADREVVEQIVAAVRGENYGFRSMIHEVVQSRIFRNK
jgi:hypothetical protein